jgi:Trk K+ transport system NAD-binding subunit/Kef-type K+ transport system membrane component KefB
VLEKFIPLLPIFLGFFILTFASKKISLFFQKMSLPSITGMLFTGIIVGPYVLNFVTKEHFQYLDFLNDVSLAFIAFYAGTELYLQELKGKIKKIIIETAVQTIIIFSISLVFLLLISRYIPFMALLNFNNKFAIALLIATIFVTNSPSSAIAIIKEMRAKGDYTLSVISVIVLIDFIVILLFAIFSALATNLVSGIKISPIFVLDVLIEISLALFLGFLLSKLIIFVFRLKINIHFKSVLVLAIGFFTYYTLHLVKIKSLLYFPFELHIEALLVCIVASFIVTNFTTYRKEFQEILGNLSPFVYVVFFTLTGAHLAIDYFVIVWKVAILLFLVRILAIMIATYLGASINRESMKYKTTAWTGYVTQAGVSIGLSIVVSNMFPTWGTQFNTLLLSVIVLNEIFGPILFKFGINRMGESHLKHESLENSNRNALIFGMEPQSVALARQLQSHGWTATIATRRDESKLEDIEEINYVNILNHSLEQLKLVKCKEYETIVLMLEDIESLKLAELIYEKVGSKNIIARIKDRTFVDEFVKLGVKVVEPYTSLVSLMDNLVRSPNATSILLGTEKNQETLDIEITDKSIHGTQLKFLRLPGDVLVLSIKRNGVSVVTHGHTRLKLGDIVTVIGSHQSLEDMALQFRGVN